MAPLSNKSKKAEKEHTWKTDRKRKKGVKAHNLGTNKPAHSRIETTDSKDSMVVTEIQSTGETDVRSDKARILFCIEMHNKGKRLTV